MNRAGRKSGGDPWANRRGESPMARIRPRINVDENGCWLWVGSTNSAGYGQMSHTVDGRRRVRHVHRVTYEIYRGEIPTDLELDHVCRVRNCVNPWHLEPVTHRENVARGTGTAAPAMRDNRCKRGHSLEDAYVTASGRKCRPCAVERQRRYRERASH